MRFKDKHVVILGGTSGIGLAVAHGVLDEGGSVSIASKRQATVDRARADLATQSSATVTAETVDVSSENSIKDFLDGIGSFDHLVYTAGDNLPLGPVVEKDLDKARECFDIRFWGAVASVKHCVRSMRDGGSITLTSGFSATRPRPGWILQAGTQSAVEGITRALALELAPLRVNCVSPGLARTPRWNAWEESFRSEFYEDEEKRLPVGRIGEAEDLALAYLYLMEDSFATGTILPVDGGGSLV
jgi:NAD(P)-dependent dehydrogenase (short-subunit alcohol dehydrogenase family)